jgi:protoheme IX farnesyltransferase
LIKTELSALVCITSAGGYILTGGSLFEIPTFLGLVTGTMMSAASASAFNQLRERNYDSLMQRTRSRPLVSGAITPGQAAAFGWLSGIGGVSLLYATTTPTTAGLALLTIGTYTLVYTPLKRTTRFNTEVGALVGAIPPVMGWTAALGSSGVMQPEALYLAATLYTWQMHHFMTIAWASRKDYARADFVMQSLHDPTGLSTVRKGSAWLASMFTLPAVSTYLGFTNPMFLVTGTAVNLYMARAYWRFYQERTTRSARQAMVAGFIQLLGFFALMTFHLENRDRIQGFQQLDQMRKEGLDWCVYHYHKYVASSHWCVWLFGKQQAPATIEAAPAVPAAAGKPEACPVKTIQRSLGMAEAPTTLPAEQAAAAPPAQSSSS